MPARLALFGSKLYLFLFSILPFQTYFFALSKQISLLLLTRSLFNKKNSDYGCSGGSLPGIINPGIYNLADYGWNDRASAIRCQ